jgi:hypothetical protein
MIPFVQRTVNVIAFLRTRDCREPNLNFRFWPWTAFGDRRPKAAVEPSSEIFQGTTSNSHNRPRTVNQGARHEWPLIDAILNAL